MSTVRLTPRLSIAAGILLVGFISLVSSIPVSTESITVVERVSVDSAATEANAPSSRSDINDDGRYVVFASLASNLVDGDTNNVKDIFLHDRQEDTTIRVSVNSGGTQGDAESDAPVISGDGRYVAYESYATNLVSGDTNGKSDIFLYDTQSGTTTRISMSTAAAQADDHSFYPAISSDGSIIAFQSAATNLVASDTNGVRDIFVHDNSGGTTEIVSVDSSEDESNGESLHPTLSEDGRYVAFTSTATNLVASDTNSVSDIFLRDRTGGTTIRVSVSSSGTEANGGSSFPAIDDDGSYIAYESVASNLVSLDLNAVRDVFVYNRLLGETSRVSVATDGTEGNNSSGDGVDEQSVNISGDGQYVVFKSRATNLVSDDTNGVVDVFVNHQRESFITSRISINNSGVEANHVSYYPSISSDGQFVSFYSYATNLVEDDTNGFGDIFVFDRDAITTTPTPTPTPTSSPTPTSTPTPTMSPTPTPTPNPVTVNVPRNKQYPTELEIETAAGTATLRCEKVNTGGTMSIYVLTSPPGQIEDHLSILKTNYDIRVSDLVCNTITLCLPYSEAEVTTAYLTEGELRMFHYNNGVWQDVTTYVDTESNKVCGRPDELSPFVLGVSSGILNTPTPTVAPGDPTATVPQPKLPDSGVNGPTYLISFLTLLLLGVGTLLIL